jgi:quercetin dioxygenase-like cupin family protein
VRPDVAPVPRPAWHPLPFEGCVNVEFKVLLADEPRLLLAMLRFGPNGTIHEHPGPEDTTVVCLEGEGFTSVGGEVSPLRAGERVLWPSGVPHRLWTEEETMTTLMIERPPGTFAGG